MRIARIANAKVVTPHGVIEGDVTFEVPDASGLVGRIVEVGNVASPTDITYDARGAWVVPGGIDAHVHFGGFGEIPIADGFYRGSRAALAGGTTTVIDFVEPDGEESVGHAIARRLVDASTSAVDYAFRLVLTEAYRSQLKDLCMAENAGIHDFKLWVVLPQILEALLHETHYDCDVFHADLMKLLDHSFNQRLPIHLQERFRRGKIDRNHSHTEPCSKNDSVLRSLLIVLMKCFRRRLDFICQIPFCNQGLQGPIHHTKAMSGCLRQNALIDKRLHEERS